MKNSSNRHTIAGLRKKLVDKFDDLTFYDTSEKLIPLPTGVFSLDKAIGIGGLPRGRIIDVYGEEGVGKTSLVNIAICSAQKRKERCCVIDVEHAYSTVLASKMGVDMEKLDLIRPMNGQDALDAMRMIAESGLYSIVCLDSVAALVTQEEMESSASDHNIAPVAQLMSSLLKKMVHPLYKTNTVAIFINQTRLKPMTMFGNPTQSTGGKALRFYASIRLEVKRNEFIKNGTDVVGSRIAVVVQKNKVAAPFEKANFDFYFNDDTQFGIDSSTELIDAGLALGAIERHGSSWFHFGEEKFNGREALKKRIAEDANFKSQLYDRVVSI